MANDKPKTGAEQLKDEIVNMITRYGEEDELTVYTAMGVLEMVKLELADMLKAAQEDGQ